MRYIGVAVTGALVGVISVILCLWLADTMGGASIDIPFSLHHRLGAYLLMGAVFALYAVGVYGPTRSR